MVSWGHGPPILSKYCRPLEYSFGIKERRLLPSALNLLMLGSTPVVSPLVFLSPDVELRRRGKP